MHIVRWVFSLMHIGKFSKLCAIRKNDIINPRCAFLSGPFLHVAAIRRQGIALSQRAISLLIHINGRHFITGSPCLTITGRAAAASRCVHVLFDLNIVVFDDEPPLSRVAADYWLLLAAEARKIDIGVVVGGRARHTVYRWISAGGCGGE
jgi:hypothetical protein